MSITTNYAEVALELTGWIEKLDADIEKACNQALTLGINAIQANLYAGHGLDTGNLKGSYAENSYVKRIGPCQYQVVWASQVDYQEVQEFVYSPHMRPGLHSAWPSIQALFEPLGIKIPDSPFEGVETWQQRASGLKYLGGFET